MNLEFQRRAPLCGFLRERDRFLLAVMQFLGLIQNMSPDFVKTLNSWVVSLCQLLALFVIVTGIIKASVIYCKHIFSNSHSTVMFQASRLELGYSFSLGLSFLVGGSILRTTITPNWNDIGKLVAIIAIRTVLNSLLLQAIDKSSSDDRESLSLESRTLESRR